MITMRLNISEIIPAISIRLITIAVVTAQAIASGQAAVSTSSDQNAFPPAPDGVEFVFSGETTIQQKHSEAMYIYRLLKGFMYYDVYGIPVYETFMSTVEVYDLQTNSMIAFIPMPPVSTPSPIGGSTDINGQFIDQPVGVDHSSLAYLRNNYNTDISTVGWQVKTYHALMPNQAILPLGIPRIQTEVQQCYILGNTLFYGFVSATDG